MSLAQDSVVKDVLKGKLTWKTHSRLFYMQNCRNLSEWTCPPPCL